MEPIIDLFVTVLSTIFMMSPFIIGFIVVYGSFLRQTYEQERFERICGLWDESRERTLWYRITH